MGEARALAWLQRLLPAHRAAAVRRSFAGPASGVAVSAASFAQREAEGYLDDTLVVSTDEFGRIVAIHASHRESAQMVLPLEVGESLGEQIAALSAPLGAALQRARVEQRARQMTGLGAWRDRVLWLGLDYEPASAPGAGRATLAVSEIAGAAGTSCPTGLAEFIGRYDAVSLALCDFVSWAAAEGAFEKGLPARLRSLAASFGLDAAALYQVPAGSRSATLLAESRSGRRRKHDVGAYRLDDPIGADLLRQPRIVEFDADLRLPEALRAVMAPGYRHAAVALCMSSGEVTGMLVMSGREACALTAHEVEAFSIAAATLGHWLMARHLREQKVELEGVVSTQQATAQAISRSLDVDHTYRAVARSVSAVVKDSECLQFAREDDSFRLTAVASSAYDAWELAGCVVTLDRGAETVDALRHEQAFLIEGGSGRHGLTLSDVVLARTDGYPLVFMPMVVRDELMGALVLYPSRRDRARYTASELHRAEAFAEQAAIAISNAHLHRNLAESTDRVNSLLVGIGGVRERERRVFASIVHDDIVQSMVAAVYELEALRDEAPEAISEDVDRAVDLLRGSIGDARRVISEMRPPVLDSMSLAESLQMLAERFDREVPCRVKAEAQHIPGLSGQANVACYRMAREALVNAIRHAGADVIRVCLAADWTLEGRVLHLVVEDDGVGIENTRSLAVDHYGLAMMEEQAAMLGGHMTVGPRSGGGTLVSISVPLAQGHNREKVASVDV